MKVNIYILDFEPWRWSALNMGLVDKWPSRIQGQWFFQSRAGWTKVFNRVQNILIYFFWGCPCLYLQYLPKKARRGRLNVLPEFLSVHIYSGFASESLVCCGCKIYTKYLLAKDHWDHSLSRALSHPTNIWLTDILASSLGQWSGRFLGIIGWDFRLRS